MTASPYRLAAPPAYPPPPRELVYRARDPEKLVRVTRVLGQTTITGGVVATAAHLGGLEPITAACFAGAAIALAALRSRAADDTTVLLRVFDGVLAVTRPPVARRGPPTTLLHARIERIANVALDTKAIRLVQEGRALVPTERFSDSKLGPEVDIARIVFDVDGEPGLVPLTQAHSAHLECVEWLGRIRTFLRAHGWVPADERDRE